MASIVLIFSHPSLGHPEATVRTCFAGQSRNLWNVCGHSPGIFGLERLFWVCVQYRGWARRNPRPTGTALRFLLGVSEGSGETVFCAQRRPPSDLAQQGVERRLPWKEPP